MDFCVSLQERPKSSHGRPKSGQGRHKSGQEGPKSDQERPYSGPRAAKSGPRAAKSVEKRPRAAGRGIPGGRGWSRFFFVLFWVFVLIVFVDCFFDVLECHVAAFWAPKSSPSRLLTPLFCKSVIFENPAPA